MIRLAIIGAGDLGKLVMVHAVEVGYDIVGFYDDTKEKNSIVNDYPVLGFIEEMVDQYNQGIFDAAFIAIGYNHMEFRKKIFNNHKGIIPFANIVHPSAFIHKTSSLGEGVIIFPGCILDINVKIGDNVLMNTGCVIAHDSAIGSHSFLSPSVTLAGFIEIGEQCNLGIGTIVIDNIKIASNVQTGAGTVVVKNIDSSGLYLGVPAKRKHQSE